PKLIGPGPSQKIDVPKSDSDKDESGGGGGGNNQVRPASEGQLPILALTQPLIAPTTRPQLTPPELAVPLTLQVDPRLQRPRDDSAIGLPNGVPGPPSDGPGLNGGIGTGDLGGIGPGKGKGLGPGQGLNTGGGPPHIGGREEAVAFDTAPVPLNRPRPNYTEEARKNKVQGLVRARVLVGADGQVKQVAIRQGLPGGLDEEAIQAAYSMRFTPARKSGNAVAVWVALEIEFNLR
ncbi:MAG: energy transducer TonB, partial [Blastocatellia bacterium]